MLVDDAVAVIVIGVVIVAVGRAGNSIGHALLTGAAAHIAGQPVVPVGGAAAAAGGAVVVELVGGAVGHEQNVQVTLVLTIGLLDGMAQLIDRIESVVIVGAGMCDLTVGSGEIGLNIHIRRVNECVGIQAGAGQDASLGITIQTCLILSTVIRIQVVGAGGAGISAVEVSNSDLDIVRTGSCNQNILQFLHRITQLVNTGHSVILGLTGAGMACALAAVLARIAVTFDTSIHGGRHIQHNNNIDAAAHGHAGSGDLDLGDAGGLEIDAGAGLADLHCALIGVLGIVVDNDLGGSLGSLGSLRNLGSLRSLRLAGLTCKCTGHSLVHGIIAGVDAACIVGGEVDAVVIQGNGHSSALTGGGGSGAGGGRCQITGAQVGEVQGLLNTAVVSAGIGHGLHGHFGALGSVVVAAYVIAVVMTEEVCNVHIGCNFVDGVEPLLCMAVVIAALEQGHVGRNEQRLGVIQTLGCGLESCDGRSDLVVGVESSIVAVVGGQIRHAQGVDVVIAVVCVAIDAVSTCAVDQAAVVGQCDLIGTVVHRSAVVIGPDVVDGHIAAQHATDIAGNGIGIAGRCSLVAGERIARTGDGADGQILDSLHNAFNSGLLVVSSAGVQVTENDCRIDDCLCLVLSCQCAEGDHAEQHCTAKQHRQGFFESLHNRFTSLFFVSAPKWGALWFYILYIRPAEDPPLMTVIGPPPSPSGCCHVKHIKSHVNYT